MLSQPSRHTRYTDEELALVFAQLPAGPFDTRALVQAVADSGLETGRGTHPDTIAQLLRARWLREGRLTVAQVWPPRYRKAGPS